MTKRSSIILLRARDKRKQQEIRDQELYKSWAEDPRRQEDMQRISPLIKEDGDG